MLNTFSRSLGVAALAMTMVAAASAPALADKAKYELKIATLAPDNTGWSKVLKEYEKKVEKASGGQINVRVFLGGVMTDDENYSVKMLSRGEIQGVGATTGAVATIINELEGIEIPFQFANSSEADYVLDVHIKDHVKKLFEKNGLVFGFWSENGFRHFGASWGKIDDPSDIKSRKVRSQESFPHLEMWKAFGAAAQALPTGEVATALKTGSVEGFDQSLLYATAGGWHLHIKHLTLSAHIYQPAVIAFNKDWFDKLPADLQKVLIDEGEALVRKGRKAIRDANKKLLQIFKDVKVDVYTLTKDERKAFVKATSKVRDKVAGRSSGHKELIELIEAGLDDFKSKKKTKK
jgi:TRAP-type C4-dicarboxylate transport system substrate-binding protein